MNVHRLAVCDESECCPVRDRNELFVVLVVVYFVRKIIIR